MESDIYYMNFENENTKGTTPTPSQPQDARKAQKCRVSRCLEVMVVCSGLICVLLLVFIILQHISVTAERESMSKNHKDTIKVLNQTISGLQATYSDLMSEKKQLQDRFDEQERESMSKNHKDTVQGLNQTISILQANYSDLMSEKKQLQDRFNTQNDELNEAYQKGYQWGSGWFFKSSVSKSWSESRQYCRDQGADLVIINSEAKQNFITSVITGYERVWIGLTDILEEGKMKWMDNSSLKQGFWAEGEPNDDNGNEDCVELLLPSVSPIYNWNDLPCSTPRKAICEK